MQNKNRHHFYTFPELLGQALVLIVLVTAVIGAFRLVETILPVDQPAVAQTGTTRTITSVSTYLRQGYISNSETLDTAPAVTIIEPVSVKPILILPLEPKLI